MTLNDKDIGRSKLNRPSLRARARPPKQRTILGKEFSAVNLPSGLSLQHCLECGLPQYPPAELCGKCLSPELRYRETAGEGKLLAVSELQHSLWEYFKRRIQQKPWLIGSVRLDAGPVMLVHLGDSRLKPGDRVVVFSHLDVSLSAVLIAVAARDQARSPADRSAVVSQLGLDVPAEREGGL